MIITLVGYMGAGKTSIGKALAESLDFSFVDLDEWITKKAGKSMNEIFQQKGEIQFRKMEREALIDILNSDQNLVLSLGGGTPAYYNNMELIQEKTTSFYLRLSPKELVDRLSTEKKQRPLIAHLTSESLAEFIAKHLFERRGFYEKSDHMIAVQQKNILEIVEEINLLLQKT